VNFVAAIPHLFGLGDYVFRANDWEFSSGCFL